MGKIFLSHSSVDKKYVEYIADHLGKDQCVFDSFCFEAGMKNLDEIYREMDKSSIFVIFLSDNSLNSKWVQEELRAAEDRLNHDTYKLAQIFPIIIDQTITHNDKRIPDFLKNGFGSYNLRFISSPQIAFRKIKAQQTKFQLESGSLPKKECFYGRDTEIKKFKDVFDLGDPIKCVIASGLPGTGRSSYLVHCLKSSHIIENYYTPPTITLQELESIEDLIVKLSQLGYGAYALEDVASIANMDTKISILAGLLSTVQDYNEVVLIHDENCVIDRRGELAYWFDKALALLRPEVTVLIAARTSVSFYTIRNKSYVFATDILTLPKNEWLGLMRIYAKQVGLELSREDCSYFSNILSGYPPQIIYAVDLMKNEGIEQVKNKPHILIEYFSPKVTNMLESIIPSDIKEDAYGLLAFFSTYGIVPNDLLNLVIQIKENYKKAYFLFKNLTIAKYTGSTGEYIEINALVSDYIQRYKYNLPSDIKKVLDIRLEEIEKIVESGENTMTEDFEDLKFYLKTNIVNGADIPVKFMYSTLYMSSIYELYNRQKYPQVIALIEKLKETGAFDRYDEPVRERIQSYFCRSLARESNVKFYDEVEFFSPRNRSNKQEEYNFLRGFMYRNESKYDKALDRYKKVLESRPKHGSAMREIVVVYRGLEDFESSSLYARDNYLNDPENLYQIQPYFEILIRKEKSKRTLEEDTFIEEMLSTVSRINQTKPSSTYYEMQAQYDTFIEHDKSHAIAILTAGLEKNPESSYLIKNLFDCYEYFLDIQGMESSLKMLEKHIQSNKAARVAYNIRQALLMAHQKKPREYIYNSINGIIGLNDDAKTRLRHRVSAIISLKVPSLSY